MSRLRWCDEAIAGFVLCLAWATALPAQTLTTLASFNGANGAFPLFVSLAQGTDGNLYGTTLEGGANNYGTVFKVTPSGAITTLYSFGLTDGAEPQAGLVLGTDGSLYGTAQQGGTSSNCSSDGCGTVFKITPRGALTTLYNFDLTHGAYPSAALLQGSDGNFYGTTLGGGSKGYGTLFKITPGGTLTSLHSFTGTDGSGLRAGLVQAPNGGFYGTSDGGGADMDGTVFKTGPGGGILTTLHSFDSGDGSSPFAGMIEANSGNFFGTTLGGGSSSSCAGGCGTVFEITPTGTFTSLHSFDSTDGSYPESALIQVSNLDLYGTTVGGGSSGACSGGCGTIFEITPAGALTVLYNFALTDGAAPTGGLVQATNGVLYGTTCGGGANNDGTVFRLALGLHPFVETVPASGKVGTPVIILGSALTGATSVTFNGAPAAFTVHSATFISANVPGGATTGKVEVTTPSHRLLSNVRFRVTQ